MKEQFSRTQMILGEDAIRKLNGSKVAVFGVGGVGGYVVEALARAGIEHFVLIDNDTVSVSNINRQIIATNSTVGKYKCDVMKDRILDINTEAEVEIHNSFFLPSNADEFDFSKYDYVVDAVDTVAAKIEIIVRAKKNNVPVISALGAGNKLNPTMFEVTDIFKTRVDPLAKVLRQELKKRRINSLKVVYSREKPIKPSEELTNEKPVGSRRSIPGSISFVPSAAGLIIASEVIKDLTNVRNDIIGG